MRAGAPSPPLHQACLQAGCSAAAGVRGAAAGLLPLRLRPACPLRLPQSPLDHCLESMARSQGMGWGPRPTLQHETLRPALHDPCRVAWSPLAPGPCAASHEEG